MADPRKGRDEDIPTGDELVERTIEWLRTKGPDEGAACFLCGENTWSVQPELVALRAFRGAAISLPGTVWPAVQIICVNCGHTVLFNAVLAGLLPGEAPTEDG